MNKTKNIALVAHDDKKQDLLEWARFNKELLIQHELYATGTTGKLLKQELGIDIHKLLEEQQLKHLAQVLRQVIEGLEL